MVESIQQVFEVSDGSGTARSVEILRRQRVSMTKTETSVKLALVDEETRVVTGQQEHTSST